MIKIEHINNFNLYDTMTCGQTFRYDLEEDDSFTIILLDRIVNVRQEKSTLIVKSNKVDNLENIIIDYFDLNRDYEKINKYLIKNDKHFKNIVDYCNGFKVLKQEPFEVFISYIISINNSVNSISKSVNELSRLYGSKVEFDSKTYYLFPKPKDLINVKTSDYRELKVGFRDINIYEFVQKVNNKEIDLNVYFDLDSIKALELMQQNRGIGPKVASCVLLMAYQNFEVYPIDTWVKKAFFEIYGTDNIKEITNISKEKFGKYSGLAVQYMFHYKRNKK
ncbi:MAG: DNA-3-methyladenine glycosylase family protein [Bacilli bacterium]